MFKLARYIKGKALVLTIIGIACIVGAAYFDATQPTFLNDAITSLSQNKWWGDNNGWQWISDGNTYWSFWPAVIMMACYAGASLIVGLLGSFLGSAAALYAAMNTREAMYNKVMSYSFNEVDKFSTASLITRLSNDVQRHQINLQMIFTMLFRAPITITISLVNAFTPPMGNVTYGCVTIAIVILMLTVITLIGLKVLHIFVKAQNKLDATNKVMRENILGARVIKAFHIHSDQNRRYQQQNAKLKKYNIRGQALMLPIMSVIQFLLNATIVIILMIAGIIFVNGAHTPINAGIYAFTQLIAIVLFSSMIAVFVIVNTTRTMASIKRINAVIDTEPSIVDKKETTQLSHDYSVQFDQVKFKFNKKAKGYVLNDVNFKIESGKTLGIIGGTGSGKSTIVNLIPRFYDVDSGSIKIGGIDVRDMSRDEINKNIGIVFQEALLFSGTIESNLKFGKSDASYEEMKQTSMDACSWDFISKLPKKFDSVVEQRGRNFSGGQKQRISLSRTLIKKPKILILDDTTSALDLLTEAKVQENLQKNYGDATKLIISQRVSSVKNADKIIILENGKILATGNHQELVRSSSAYRQIVESQLGTGGLK
ncbi:MAG: ABC transporter ATP-binding protein/permease [Mycoplasmataceae bacterium]|nr:ABC transporter ATP-binding protein/permease [Mycoplasmataceae bacterium]